MEKKEIEIKGNGIKVSTLSIAFIIVGVITMVASLLAIRQIYNKYDKMMDSYQFEEIEREAARSFEVASDYLTDQARRFAVMGDVEYANNYFNEKDVVKRREQAIATIEESHSLELESELLYHAMDLSQKLVVQEVHAMKLVAEAKNLENALVPQEVASYILPEAEEKLSEEDKQNLAIQLLYNNDYEVSKDRINWDIDSAIVLIKDESGARYRENESDLIVMLNVATALIFVMFVLLVLIFICNTLLVVNPAKKFTKLLDKDEKLPAIGGYEFRNFARKYNDIYRSNKKNRELLREQGEVDELTGTLKVATLDLIRHNLSQSEEPVGIMMVDIDKFRSMKETNGYDMADKVVAKVANLFLESFKSSDYVVRTSQDEFEIFLLKMRKEDSEMLQERIAQINQKLQDTKDGVIAASVSVGVAFSESGYNVETERMADMALNSVKENGRGTCKIS